MHNCGHCGEKNPESFYGNKKTVCAKCHNSYTMKLGKEKRKYAVAKLGGKCISCGFDKWIVSLDIHHLDPSTKDPKFSQMRGWSLSRIDREIKNCVLLCRNCHAAHHGGFLELDDL